MKIDKNTKNRRISLISLLLALTVAFTAVPFPVMAAGKADGQEKEDVHIQSEADFLKFAENCRVDSWSQDRKVYLDRDLDLSDESYRDFAGVSTFSGTFNGQGFTISGYELGDGTEAVGLFHYLEEGAVIKNLVASGSIDTEDGTENVGGIVGVNSGKIKCCTFNGTINAKGIAGGIAGLNGTAGVIADCTAQGAYASSHTIGGVAGENRGVISDSVNQAEINSDSSWFEEQSSGTTSISIEGLVESAEESVESGKDIGGIAGFSTGIIAGCSNESVVGYLYTGENVGGIVGRQKGSIINCSNSGKVYGKQDVGGIVGQFEPTASYSEMEQIDSKVNDLHDAIDVMINDMDGMSSGLTGDISSLENRADDLVDTTDSLLTELKDVISSDVTTVNDLLSRADYVSDHLPKVLSYVDDAVDALEQADRDMDAVSANMDKTTADVDSIINQLDGVNTSLDAAAGKLATAADKIDINTNMQNNTYQAAKNKRLALMSGVGGSLKADNTNPAESANVVITAVPDAGYELVKLTLTPYGGKEEDVTKSVVDNKYTFKMPAANVTVAALYEYTGEVLAESNLGGKVQISRKGKNVKVRVVSENGYELDQVTISGNGMNSRISMTYVSSDALSGNTVGYYEGTCTLSSNSTESANAPYFLRADFSAVSSNAGTITQAVDSRYVNTRSTTGGTVAAVASGNTLRVAVKPGSHYRLKELRLYADGISGNGQIIKAGELSVSENDMTAGSNDSLISTCTISDNNAIWQPMDPGGADPVVEAVFEPVALVIRGGVGGTASYSLTDGKVRLTIEPDTGYVPSSLTISNEDGTAIAYERKNQDSYIYEFPVSSISGRYAVAAVIFSTQTDKKTVEQARSRLKNNSYDLSAHAAKLSDDADQIENITTDEFGDTKTSYTEEEKEELLSDFTDALTELSEIAEISGQMISDMNIILEVLEPYLETAAEGASEAADAASDAMNAAGDAADIASAGGKTVNKDINTLYHSIETVVRDMSGVTDAVDGANTEVTGIVNYLNALDDLSFATLSDDFDQNTDKVTEELDDISDILDRLNSHVDSYTDQLEADMRQVNDQMTLLFDLIIKRITDIEEMSDGTDVYEDRSTKNEGGSSVAGCSNTGGISARYNAGGIAGTMGIETTDTDSESSTGFRLGSKYIVRAQLSDSENSGFVTAKTQYAGGIAGKVTSGYIHDCESGGRIGGDACDSAGGIAGYSEGTIKKCASGAEIYGNEYLGGIAGEATKVTGCYSIVTISDYTGKVGAIAGSFIQSDQGSDDETWQRSQLDKQFKNNYYVSSSLYGIDGLSYEGIATPLTYQEMLKKKGAPESFSHLTVTFVDEDGQVVESEELPYGYELSELEYPVIQAEDGSYYEWLGAETGRLESNLIYRASAATLISVLASNETENGKARALVEGSFTKEAALYASDAGEDYPGASNVWTVNLVGTDITDSDTLKIRLYTGDAEKEIYSFADGKWTKLSGTTLGSYTEVEMTGAEAVYAIVPTGTDSHILLYAAGGGALVVILALVIVLLRKKRKNRAGKSDSDQKKPDKQEKKPQKRRKR